VQNVVDAVINFASVAVGFGGGVDPLSTVFGDALIGARQTGIKGVVATGNG